MHTPPSHGRSIASCAIGALIRKYNPWWWWYGVRTELKEYRQITVWENARRCRTLQQFLNDTVTFFSNSQPSNDSEEANQARSRMNLSLRETGAMVRAGGVDPVVQWSLPLMLGEATSNVDVMENVFNLQRFGIPPHVLIDLLQRAMGVYWSDQQSSLWRSFNPLWWIWQFLAWFAHLPFSLLDAAGFNSSRAESSFLGRIIKLVFTMVPLVASILVILHHLGLLEGLKAQLGI